MVESQPIHNDRDRKGLGGAPANRQELAQRDHATPSNAKADRDVDGRVCHGESVGEVMGQLTIPWGAKDLGSLRKINKEQRQAIKEARAHVYRQQHHGKHDQDRADAVEWLKKWGK
jgi:hypothetical protein